MFRNLLVVTMLLTCQSSWAREGPSTAQIEKDIRGKNTISVEFTADNKGKTVRYIEDGREYTEYSIGGIRVKAKARVAGYDKAVTAIVDGDAVYRLSGSKYVFHQFRIAANKYEGIPGAPTSEDVLKMIRGNQSSVLAGENQNIVTAAPQISLSHNPNFTWAAATKFTCTFTARCWYRGALPYDEKGDYVAMVDLPFEFRVFRDSINSPWRDPSASAKPGKLRIIKRLYMPAAEIAELMSLWELQNEK